MLCTPQHQSIARFYMKKKTMSFPLLSLSEKNDIISDTIKIKQQLESDMLGRKRSN